jgi:hypothetical protein
MECFAKRHRRTLNKLLRRYVANTPAGSTFRLQLPQLDVDECSQ